jgi:asparaginyl-tRNA synthetase
LLSSGIEPEVAFNDLNDNMDLAEDFIQYVIKYTWQMSWGFKIFRRSFIRRRKSKPQAERSEMALLEKLNFVLENNFKRVSYTEAIDILREYK